MAKKEYSSPELDVLGTVRELTERVIDKCIGSADLTLPREVPTEPDFDCVIDGGTT